MDETSFRELVNRIWLLGEEHWRLGLSMRQLNEYLRDCIDKTEIDESNAEDLYIACACTHRLPKSIESFLRHYSIILHWMPWQSSNRIDFSIIDLLLIKLFYREPPAIKTYHGGYPMNQWLRGVIARLHAEERRKARKYRARFSLENEIELITYDANFELAFEKETTQEILAQSLHLAIQQLSPQQRILLKEYYVEKISTTALAEKYRLHHSTISSRIRDINNSLRRRMQGIYREHFRGDIDIKESITELAGAIDLHKILGILEK